MAKEAKNLNGEKRLQVSESTMAKRERIIGAALNCFYENGFNDAKISDIAAKAGVADGTIYEYFANKEDLLFSITTEKWKEVKEMLTWHLGGIQGALNKIRKYIWFCLDSFEADPAYAAIFLLYLRTSKKFVETPSYEHVRAFAQVVLELVKEGKQEGSIEDTVNAEMFRRLVLGSVENITTRWVIGGCKGTIREFAEPLAYLLIRSIQKKS